MLNKKNNIQENTAKEKKPKAKKANSTHNWYYDRYNIVVVQRNFLSLLVLISTVLLLIGLIYIKQISQNKSIEPFIVEIEEKTGVPTLVDQVSIKQFTADEVMQEYFIYKYVKARHGYDYRTYSYDYHRVIRLLSAQPVYNKFRYSVSARNENSPVNLYGRKIRLMPVIKSIQDIEGAKQIRILVQHSNGNTIIKQDHKIVYMKYEFANLNISLEERLINPLGFRVVEYKVDQDFIAE